MFCEINGDLIIYKVIFMNGIEKESIDCAMDFIKSKVSNFVDKEIENYLKN